MSESKPRDLFIGTEGLEQAFRSQSEIGDDPYFYYLVGSFFKPGPTKIINIPTPHTIHFREVIPGHVPPEVRQAYEALQDCLYVFSEELPATRMPAAEMALANLETLWPALKGRKE